MSVRRAGFEPVIFIGLMSGTSLDGTDGVLARISGNGFVSLAHHHEGFEPGLQAELLALNDSGAHELHRAALATNALMRCYARVVQALLAKGGVEAQAVAAIGAHGQTVRHCPAQFDGTGYTLQLVNGALLAELTRIDVVCDFRSRDVAAGGQGAPLVPAFHNALFNGGKPSALAVLNLGGIANLSLRDTSGKLIGFDTGPGNMLLDAWVRHCAGIAFDAGGLWAAGGAVNGPLLNRLLSEPFFSMPAPKSTGRDLFNLAWLKRHLNQHTVPLGNQDVQATLAELTATSVAQALRLQAIVGAQQLWVCGGGAHNLHLMSRIAAHLPGWQVSSTAERGVPVDQMEALAFAWLAHMRLSGAPANLPEVTGAAGQRVLGAHHPR